MGLPTIQAPTETVTLSDGSKVELRGLSRGEAVRMSKHRQDIAALELALITASTGEPEDEVRSWYDAAPSGDVQVIVEAVMRLSGMDADAGKASSGD